MDEYWELLTFDSPGIVICSPGLPPKTMNLEDYLKSKGGNYKLSLKSGYWDVYPFILTDGWEPFGIMENKRVAFRRKVKK